MTALPCFLCDEMLGRLARYLRAAGYDTMLATGGTADRDLLHLAAAEARYFLTLDRAIPQHKASAGIVFLLPNGDTLPPTGRSVEIRGMEVVQVRPDGKIVLNSLYYDNLASMSQLGLIPEAAIA